MADSYDVVVVGAGSVGSAAAHHAARAGKRVLLLEQFELGHTRGSSHGESRIIRHSYSSSDYATLAPAAFHLWAELERESGESLLLRTGGIDLGPAANPALLACRQALTEAGFGSVWLEGREAQAYAKQFILPDDWAVLYQSGAGILNASWCVSTLATQAQRHGAVLVEHARVDSILPSGGSVAVRYSTSDGQQDVEAGAAIIAAGPWAGRFFSSLGLDVELRVTHQQVVYYPVEEPSLWAPNVCPIYIGHGRSGFYGFPIAERPGYIKVGIELDAEITDADEPSREPDPAALAQLNEIVTKTFRGVRPEPADVVVCRYTETADRDFIIDRHPKYPNVVLASPCSGHGFKFSILTGQLAAELATTPEGTYKSPHWRERFALTRPATASPTNALATEWRA